MWASDTRICLGRASPVTACRTSTRATTAPIARPATPPRRGPTISFNHDKATKFPLRGGHAKLACEQCHTGDLYRDKLSMACVACHRKDDPHRGQLGSNCQQCHKETGWRQKVVFDHDLTRFPLIGLHAVVPCEECHRTQSFKDAPRACASCQPDTHHVGRLGANCASCHNPNGWTRWRFDHDKQTRYPLTGAHHALQCHACHKETNVTRGDRADQLLRLPQPG